VTRTATRRKRNPRDAAVNVSIGTASWQDRSLIEAKLFYPADVTSEG
jgi:hypothetical protein